jgi:hypothetical protein
MPAGVNNIMILKNFINGQTLDNAMGKTFDVINPATGKLAYQVEEADESIRFVNSNKNSILVYGRQGR